MRRPLNRIGLIPIFLISLVSPLLAAGDFSFKTGLGYEFISQEYFLDSLAAVGADSLETVTSLKTTYLDDIRGQLTLTYTSPDRRLLELGGILEQTPDIFRARFTSNYRPTLGRLKADWNGELDWRQGVGDSTEAGDGYLLGYGKARFMLPISGASSLWWQVQSEFVRFDSAGSYNFDHNRYGGKLGLVWSMKDLSSLSVNAFLMTRFVPDSSSLDYQSYGVEASYFGFKSRSTLDMYGRLEKKDYRLPADRDDYTRLELNGRHKFNLTERLFFQQEWDLEAHYFVQTDFVNRNYRRLKLVLQTGIQGVALSAALGPHMELLSEAQEELVSGEDYFEGGIRTNIDFFRPNLFGLLESTLGHRNIYSEAELQSDFVFHRFNFMVDWRFGQKVSLNAMISAEWEWHDHREENSQLYLVSSWLTCRF